jgi:hypothetical protein
MAQMVQQLSAFFAALQLTPAGLSLPVPAHRVRSYSTDSSLLRKPSMAFSTSSIEKRGFQLTPIFNGLQPSKMAAHSCAAYSLLKNVVFQQAASPCYVSRTIERAARGTETDSPAHS